MGLNRKIKTWVKEHEGEIGAAVLLTAIPAIAATAIYYIGKSRGGIWVQLFLTDKDGTAIPVGEKIKVR